MKLDQFISQTLVSIVSGIDSANKEVFEKKLCEFKDKFVVRITGDRQDDAQYINFDVAVSTTSEVAGETKRSGNIMVASLEANVEGKKSSENFSRIKFKILCRSG